jgi:acyl-[acyl carrier protein]--UDP-N-acetylglucosamine O-acyltransferase
MFTFSRPNEFAKFTSVLYYVHVGDTSNIAGFVKIDRSNGIITLHLLVENETDPEGYNWLVLRLESNNWDSYTDIKREIQNMYDEITEKFTLIC